MFDVWETRVRELLGTHLRAIDPKYDVKIMVDLLRVLTNGLTLSTIEHPDRWPAENVLAVLREAAGGLGLAPRKRRRQLAGA